MQNFLLFNVTFILEIFILLRLSKNLSNKMLLFLLKLTKRKRLAVYLYAIIFALGTFIHEASHFLTALFLLVPVREFEILPKIENEQVKLGSTPIAKTDPIRRFLIGVAPLIFGIAIIFTVIYYIISNNFTSKILYIFLVTYVVFEVSNTMFLSKKDIEGIWKFLLISLSVLIIIYLISLNLSIDYSFIFNDQMLELLKFTNLLLLFPIVMDATLILILGKLI
ncbi:hypothetical protein A2Z22_01115 [Candidatus Woesebacteria bacterium RBG_16_34_12]|uniref:Uncharacterized protein n=1 Tax=Candidatus Woesebacteria bacterium RBG_16_34_12 TaxID=1802480 RepID=A0A1F7XA01_9BACT|nr:MAG: hypothetical protein A2Z22_01115 [Candidatus Woesebacteria bacterium RBG_16_34_12]